MKDLSGHPRGSVQDNYQLGAKSVIILSRFTDISGGLQCWTQLCENRHNPLSSDWASRFFTNPQNPLAARILGGVLDKILSPIVVES
jgi:hypothetical protein